MATKLAGMRVAIIATDMVEEIELTQPREALEEAGAITELLSPKKGEIVSANHFDKSTTYPVDVILNEVVPAEYDALLLPGGALNADLLRVEPLAQEFVQHFDQEGKPIAVICHGAWLLVSAGIVDGRNLTSFHTIADDIQNAGGDWTDQPVVIDSNLVSSRKPDDIPVFNQAMIKLFSSSPALV